MSAPTASALRSEFLAALDGLFKDDSGSVTSEQDEWLDALTSALSSAWQDWEDNISGGALTVSGSGLGTWTGTGDGGSLSEGVALDWTAQPSFGRTGDLAELDDALGDHTADRFATWAGDYSFSGASYEGTSTATSSSSGTFEATPVGTEVLANIGSGTAPSAVKGDVLSTLDGQGWNTGADQAEIDTWLAAYDAMIQNQFDEWLAGVTWNDNFVSGAAASGTGSGSATSNPDDGTLQ